ncbi:hypothetical protein ACZ90_11470 [Streptomyces albus subsp. albus]|nr:hypothetical protein ACZ90_11470 [Streptomyces albus subsp. albus]
MAGSAVSTMNALDEHVWAGVQKLLDDYANLQPQDDVVIVYSPDAREPAAWVYVALEERGLKPAIINMIPLRDPGFYERLSRVVPASRKSAGKCVCLIFELHTMSHNKTIKTVFAKYQPDQYTVIRAINSGRDLFTTGLAVHPERLSALNTAILEKCRPAQHLRVETPAGTDLRIELDNSRFRWISNRGIGQPGKFLIIPPGEVATYPAKIDGTLVADFAINVNTYYTGDVRLERNPVTVRIEDGRMADMSCPDPKTRAFLEDCFRRTNAERVGELGLGTNTAVRVAVPENSHLNERVPGVHIGFGDHNQSAADTGYDCNIHIDLCAKGGRVWFDDAAEPLDLENVTPSTRPHPSLVNSEDLFSDDAEEDCCGLLT